MRQLKKAIKAGIHASISLQAQVRTKILGRVGFFKTPTGSYYLPVDAPHDAIAGAIRRGEVFEQEVIDLAAEFIKEGTVALDVGANFGQMAILFAKMTGERGRVYAFEADDFIYGLLRKNIEANKVQNISAIFGAVYDEDGRTLIFPTPDFKKFSTYGAYGVAPKATEGRQVKTLTIDSLNIEAPVSFMKIDVQGADLHVLRGAKKTIAKHRMPILFEFEQQFQEDFGTNFQKYVDFVASIDYVFDRLTTESGLNFLVVPRKS